jgi:hypothetical protein
VEQKYLTGVRMITLSSISAPTPPAPMPPEPVAEGVAGAWKRW